MRPDRTLALVHHAPAPKRPYEIVGCRTDRPLGQYGQAMAKRLVKQLDRLVSERVIPEPSHILTSPLQRATMTAQHVAAAFACPIIVIDTLRAQDFGALDGMTETEVRDDAELRQHLHEAVQPGQRDSNAPTGGESNLQFMTRIASAMQFLLSEWGHTKALAIVHGTVIDAALVDHFSRDSLHAYEGINRAMEGRILTLQPGERVELHGTPEWMSAPMDGLTTDSANERSIHLRKLQERGAFEATMFWDLLRTGNGA